MKTLRKKKTKTKTPSLRDTYPATMELLDAIGWPERHPMVIRWPVDPAKSFNVGIL